MEMSHTRLDMYGFTKISFAWIDQYYITEQLTQLDNTHSFPSTSSKIKITIFDSSAKQGIFCIREYFSPLLYNPSRVILFYLSLLYRKNECFDNMEFTQSSSKVIT